jgi:hypothetical protein
MLEAAALGYAHPLNNIGQGVRTQGDPTIAFAVRYENYIVVSLAYKLISMHMLADKIFEAVASGPRRQILALPVEGGIDHVRARGEAPDDGALHIPPLVGT